ncbi:ABC transporter substrate-binding protein [Streptomyces sp. NPDC090106]|uniref:ABC transporter substrate-binding protein n=1 Tax=Streptomyces sp. NPDC090106 TaxID=3365946 RepID=UPI00382B5946
MNGHHTARPLSRRTLLGAVSGLGAAGLLSACGGVAAGSSGGGSVRTQLSWLKDVTFAGHYIADHEGYFRSEHIKGALVPGGPSVPDTVTPAVAGAADVALADFAAVIAARAQGADLVAIGAVLQTSPGGFVSLASRPVRTAKDLVGSRIGLSPGSEVLVEAILRLNRLPVRYTRVPVGSGTAALTKGQCDVMACYVTSQPLALKAAGHDVVAVTQSDLGMPDYALVMAARRSDIDKRRDDYVGYLRAVARGYRRNLDSPALGTKLTLEVYGKSLGLDPGITAAENLAQNHLVTNAYTDVHGLCAVDPEQLSAHVYPGLRARGTKTLPPVPELLDGSLIAEAHG